MLVKRTLLAAAACLILTGVMIQPAGSAPRADLWPLWDTSVETSEVSIDHGPWQGFLGKYLRPSVDDIHRLAYRLVTAADRNTLNDYIGTLSAQDPRTLRRAEQFAYWVNLYNALTVEVVLRHPTKNSILRMGGRLFAIGPWDDPLITVAGQAVTLNDIEHRILRPIWRDRRIHYAVNCASLSCPNLATQAYTASNAEQLLAAGEIAYINHPRGVSFDGRGRPRVSEIYDWYGEDFATDDQGLLEYFAQHHEELAAQLRSYQGRIRYAYDWSLNGVGK